MCSVHRRTVLEEQLFLKTYLGYSLWTDIFYTSLIISKYVSPSCSLGIFI